MLRELGGVLGLLHREEKSELSDEIKNLLSEREQARKEKNWARSDEIRDCLKEKGIIVKDTAQGQMIVTE